MSEFRPASSSVTNLAPITLMSASAGTGKTWAITHIAARWLLENPGVEARQILMVTFGREPANELKARLRGRLEEILTLLNKLVEGSGPAYEEAAEWQRHFLELAQAAGPVVLRDTCQRALAGVEEVNARTIHSFAQMFSDRTGQIAANAEQLRSRAIRESLVANARQRPEDVAQLRDRVRSTLTTPSNDGAIRRISSSLRTGLSRATAMGGLRAGARSVVRLSAPDVAAQEVARLMMEAEAREEELLTLTQSVTYDVLIGDLLRKVRQSPAELRRVVEGQFGLVLIDEFQDTDAAQWEIFATLFADVPKVLVGDPKQAIYGFRGGDVTVFQRLSYEITSGGRGEIASLDTNFRSRQRLIEQLNTLFGEWRDAEQNPWLLAPDGPRQRAVTYEPVHVAPHHQGNEGLLEIRALSDDAFAHVSESGESAVVSDVVATIRSLCAEDAAEHGKYRNPHPGPWRYADIVVLCRTNSQIQAIHSALQRSAIPAVLIGGRSVFLSPATVQLRSLLWALSEVHNPRRWRLLMATWFRSLLDERDGIDRLGRAASVVARSVGALQREVMTEELLRDVLGARDGQRNVTDLDHLFELLAEAFPFGTSPSLALDWLEDEIRSANEASDDDVSKQLIASDEDAVRLMTIHKAKGLQFPVVLLPDMPKASVNDPLLLSDTTDDGLVLDVGSVLVDSAERKSRASAEHRYESRRLMYVALTRAEVICVAWTQAPPSRSTEPSEWMKLVQPVLDRAPADAPHEPLVTVVTAQDVQDRAARPPRVPRQRLVEPEVLTLPKVLSGRWRQFSFTNVSHTIEVRGDVEVPDSPDQELRGGVDERAESSAVVAGEVPQSERDPGFNVFGPLRGAAFGTALHAVFERLVGRLSCDDPGFDSVVREEFARHDVTATDALVHRVRSLMERSLGAPFAGRSLESFAHSPHLVASEMRFHLPLHQSVDAGDALVELARIVAESDREGFFRDYFVALSESERVSGRLLDGFLNGSLDLVADVGEGDSRFLVLDYKTNGLTRSSDYTPASLREEMAAAHYPLQALLYAVALHQFLRARFDGYNPERHLGGATYFYVRGALADGAREQDGVVHWAIDSVAVQRASSYLSGERT